ncbi:uncharacterized protein ACBT44_014334 [Syngnathus typhle]
MIRRQKVRKAPGPDGASPSCLKVCAEQLVPTFARIFNCSLELCEVPLCFKSSTILPVAKQPAITVCLPGKQVGGRCGQHGTALHPALPEHPRNICQDPVCGLQLGVQHHRSRHPPTEAHPARGACLHLSVKLLKYTDDTTLIGLIQEGDETAYRQKVERLVHCCSQNHLEINPLKTVEMTVVFRRDPSPLSALTIRSNTILSTDTFKFLGTTISWDLKWTSHTDSVRKKAQQRLYFLRQLRRFNLPQELLKTFYTAIIQSILCTSITVWFGSASKQDKHRLQQTIRTAEMIIEINARSTEVTCHVTGTSVLT